MTLCWHLSHKVKLSQCRLYEYLNGNHNIFGKKKFNTNGEKSKVIKNEEKFDELKKFKELNKFKELIKFNELSSFNELTNFNELSNFNELNKFSETENDPFDDDPTYEKLFIRDLLYNIMITNIGGTRIIRDLLNKLCSHIDIPDECKYGIIETAAYYEHNLMGNTIV